MSKDYLYRWNFEENKLEMIVGEAKGEYDDVRETLDTWFEPDGATSYDDDIDLDGVYDDGHVYNYILLLPEQDDERAYEIFKEELEQEIYREEKALETKKKVLTALQEMGA